MINRMIKDENKALYEARPWLKWYPKGVPSDVEIPEASVVDTFDEATDRWKDKTAVVFYGRKMSYRELRDQVDRFATALHDLGIRKGDKVALLLLNSPQFIIAYIGALKAGATITAISPVYVSPEIKHQLEDCEAKMIVCMDILYDKVEKSGVKLDAVILTSIDEYLPRARKLLGGSVLRAVYQKMAAPPEQLFERERVYRFQDLLKKYPPNPPKIKFNLKEDLVTLPYTGGTTGTPKGAMINHYNFSAARIIIDTWLGHILEPGKEVLIAYLPFYHIYGQSMIMMEGLVEGYTQVLLTTPEPDDILNAIANYKATLFFSVPSFYEFLRNYERTSRVNWKRIKILISAADALLEDTSKGWEERTGTKLHEAWGMTETSAPGMITPYNRIKTGSFGVPLPSTVAAIIEPDGTRFLPVGEVGELLFKGPNVIKGYWDKPKASSEMFIDIDGERWLRTGDLASMDEEGYFYFYDRKRDMIKYKGLQVFAREVEEVIASHPHVKEAAVVGVADSAVGEKVKAIVVLETEARGRVSEEDIMQYVAERLAHYKVPKIIELRGEVPKTDIGKVSRRELREEG